MGEGGSVRGQALSSAQVCRGGPRGPSPPGRAPAQAPCLADAPSAAQPRDMLGVFSSPLTCPVVRCKGSCHP